MEKTRKRSLQLLFISFMLYAILGWCYEVFLEVVIYKWGFTNRGVLFGPYCPVYGVGALTFLFILDKIMRKKDSLLFKDTYKVYLPRKACSEVRSAWCDFWFNMGGEVK